MDADDSTEMQGVIKALAGRMVTILLHSDIDFVEGDEIDIEIKKHRDKRSLSANAYFHVLVDKLRQVLKISFAECKNNLITSYGQIDYIGDEQVIIKTNIPPEVMRTNESLHCLCVKASKEENTEVYFYRVYRGSHTYNSAEMAKLIDGTIEECKLQDIETLSPFELARLEGYEKHDIG